MTVDRATRRRRVLIALDIATVVVGVSLVFAGTGHAAMAIGAVAIALFLAITAFAFLLRKDAR